MSTRIYVASLSDYNAGNLHGTWIDLDGSTTVDEVWEQVNEMLASGEPGAEEWAIHDHEGFGTLLGEYESLDAVVLLAAAIDDLGDAFVAYAENELGASYVLQDVASAVDNFNDAYRGEWASLEEFAENLAEEYGWFDAMERAGMSSSYFDSERFARDLRLGGDFSYHDGYVFGS